MIQLVTADERTPFFIFVVSIMLLSLSLSLDVVSRGKINGNYSETCVTQLSMC